MIDGWWARWRRWERVGRVEERRLGDSWGKIGKAGGLLEWRIIGFRARSENESRRDTE